METNGTSNFSINFHISFSDRQEVTQHKMILAHDFLLYLRTWNLLSQTLILMA